MKTIFQQDPQLCRVEIYNEYLKKIAQLLQQIQTVEKMCQKADIEDEMLQLQDKKNPSVLRYQERIHAIQTQAIKQLEELQEELQLILRLKAQIEPTLKL